MYKESITSECTVTRYAVRGGAKLPGVLPEDFYSE